PYKDRYMARLDRLLLAPTSAQSSRGAVSIERLRWVIGLRWTVVAALLAVGLLGNSFRGDSPQTRAAHIGLAVLMLVYNLFYLLAIRRPDFGQTGLTRLVQYAQVPVDLLVFTVMVHFSGGITSPVFVLYFLYVFVGLAILPPSGAYWVAGTAALFYGALALLEEMWLKPAAGRFVGETGPSTLEAVG